MPQRIKLVETVLADLPNVKVHGFDGLLVNFARTHGAKVIIRGLRTMSDFEHESQLASMNHQLAPEIETIFIPTAGKYAHVSSSLIREIAALKGDVSPFVNPVVAEALKTVWC